MPAVKKKKKKKRSVSVRNLLFYDRTAGFVLSLQHISIQRSGQMTDGANASKHTVVEWFTH